MNKSWYILFPYCLHRLEDGRYIALNRLYKPLGIQSSEWVDYNIHPSALNLMITPAIAKMLSWEGSDVMDRIFLYCDGCAPWVSAESHIAYLNRLSALMSVEIQATQ